MGRGAAGPAHERRQSVGQRPPTCFCEHCHARGKADGIDAERARKGYRSCAYVQGQMARHTEAADGVFGGFLRILMRYPEILGWEYQYRLAARRSARRCTSASRAIKPTAEVGWHVDHQPSSWDMVYRAEMSYEEMAPHADFIKIIVYHNVLVAAHPRLVSAALPADDPRRGLAGDVARALLRPVRLRQARGTHARRARRERFHARLRVPRDEAQRRKRQRQDEDLRGRGLRRAGQPAR